MAKSSSRLKPTNLLVVPFRVLELSDNCFSCWLRWSENFRFLALGAFATTNLGAKAPTTNLGAFATTNLGAFDPTNLGAKDN
ncbi:MAG: hypothetical protein DRR08_10670 [Candidatus Parabeggiatoa sp. nov. 2]|nr:MAG: hypothetical protein B6247_12665 [Beggiatoa sp. 4572_84]RKZ60697.1 MAG: hypothetical protein DRR08_10670 [Gammaproteobacteria bacterium]